MASSEHRTDYFQIGLYNLRGEVYMQNEMIFKRENQEIADEARKSCLIEHPGLPVWITIETTNNCNLKCRICQIKRPKLGKNFSFKLFTKISKEVFPSLKILHPTTIGEPLLSPYFNEMINLLSKYRVKLDLTTNAMLLSSEKIKKILPILDDIKISIDGANSKTLERIRIGADWRKLLKNIEKLVKLRNSMKFTSKSPTITFQMTIMKSNYKELEKMIDLAANLGIDRIKAYHLFAFSEEMNNESVMNLKEEYNKIYENAKKRAKIHNIEAFLAAPFELNNSKIFIKNKNINKVPCPLLWHAFWIDINGDILPCANPTRIIMGNIHNQTIKEIWNGEPYKKLREGFKHKKIPKMCEGCGYQFEITPKTNIPYDERNFLYPYTFKPDYTYILRWSGRTAQLLDLSIIEKNQ